MLFSEGDTTFALHTYYERVPCGGSEATYHRAKLIRMKQAPGLAPIGKLVANTRYKLTVVKYPEEQPQGRLFGLDTMSVKAPIVQIPIGRDAEA